MSHSNNGRCLSILSPYQNRQEFEQTTNVWQKKQSRDSFFRMKQDLFLGDITDIKLFLHTIKPKLIKNVDKQPPFLQPSYT